MKKTILMLALTLLGAAASAQIQLKPGEHVVAGPAGMPMIVRDAPPSISPPIAHKPQAGDRNAAEFVDYSDLVVRLTQPPGLEWANAMGYIAGIADTTGFIGVTCIPPQTKQRALENAVIFYTRKHLSDRGDVAAHIMVARALQEAFPCKAM